MRYLADVARAGGYLHFSSFDFEFDTPFPDMPFLINYLERADYGERMFFSIGTNITVDESGRVRLEAEQQHPETGKPAVAYAITNAAPVLMAADVSLQRI